MTIEEPALRYIEEAARHALPNEVGGILIGYRQDAGVHVARAVVVPDPSATSCSYAREHAAAQAVLEAVRADEANHSLLGWVGEWHSHPKTGGPSSTDLRELARLAEIDGRATALIVIARGRDSWRAHACLAVSQRVHASVLLTVQDRG